MRLPFGRIPKPIVPVIAAACLAAASSAASAMPVCRTALPDGRIILTRPIAREGRLFCRGPFIPRRSIAPKLGGNALPFMGYTTGRIGPFTTGEIGPFTTFSNSVPRSGRPR